MRANVGLLMMVLKINFLWFCSAVLICSPGLVCAKTTANVPETQQEKEGYSVGYQIGTGMNYDGAEVDLDYLLQGIKDAKAKKEPVLGREEMRSLLIDLRKNAREHKLKAMQELIVKNAKESDAFLEENGRRDEVKTTESGLQYIVLQEGTGDPPRLDDMVTVHYRGSFIDGTEFDSSYARGKPERFATDGVIKGWTEALQMMRENAKWKLFVPPDLAYGRTGLEGSIPPNKVLVFEIELISIDKQKMIDQDS
jgi:FKBP-type peptidyl-prolyl cis-trans isomerase FklB